MRAGREVPEEDIGRIISHSDGVFAFALTRLVLGPYAAWDHRRIDPKLPDDETRYFAIRGILPSVAFGASILVSSVGVSWAEQSWVAPLVLNHGSHRYAVD